MNSLQQAALRANSRFVAIADASTKLYKDECLLCCRSSQNSEGLFVNLTSFTTLCHEHLEWESSVETDVSRVYLHLTDRRVYFPQTEKTASEEMPTQLAIGVPGGFRSEERKSYSIERQLELYLLPQKLSVPLSPLTENSEHVFETSSLQEEMKTLDIPLQISQSCISVIEHTGSVSLKADTTTEWVEELKESKYAATLPQCEPAIQIPPSNWKCEACGATSNLWMNLSDGYIGCGRKQYGGAGGGCQGGKEGAAVLHYEENRSCPLAVKLGSLSPSSPGDVYSYAEQSMVLDPYLDRHLAHFGIKLAEARKTEQTMEELQIEHNKNYNWSRVTEDGLTLRQVNGSGFVGLKNLGNTCYMNSILQLICSRPECAERFAFSAQSCFLPSRSSVDLSEDFVVQFVKLCRALQLEDYVAQQSSLRQRYDNDPNKPKDEDGKQGCWVSPWMFRRAAVLRHAEFSSTRQQDAEEFFRYFVDKLAERERQLHIEGLPAYPGTAKTFSDLFTYKVESRLQCLQSNQVRYSYDHANIFSLPIPASESVKPNNGIKRMRTEELSEVSPEIPFEMCLSAWATPAQIDDFKSPATGKKGNAVQQCRFATFPHYLFLQMKRFYLAPDWTPQKLQNPIQVPLQLDLTSLRGQGRQEGETELPDREENESPTHTIDPLILQEVTSMGFTENAISKAVAALGPHATCAACVDWLLAHIDDSTLNDPPQKKEKSSLVTVDTEATNMLQSMGFTLEQSKAALLETGGTDISAATEWLFQHSEDIETAVAAVMQRFASPTMTTERREAELLDGLGVYDLVGFVSHVGHNANCGHYVCHLLRKEHKEETAQRWFLYNDCKVAESLQPPLDLGYLYLYRRRH